MNPGPFLLLALLALAAGGVGGLRFPRAWLGFSLIGALAGLAAALGVLLGAPDWEWRGVWRLGGDAIHLRLDGVSALFLVLLSVVSGLGALYAREYWSDAGNPSSAPRGRAWWSVLTLSMGLVLLAANGLHFLIAWELFAVSAFFLITLDARGRATRAAGWLYLAASHAGTLVLFAFFGLLAARTGSWDLGPMQDQPALASLLWLALVGFGVKAGVFPLHIWLPSAHANAPSHVSALMSGVAIKMGIYGLVRFSGWLPAPRGAAWALMGFGAASAVLGIAFALAQSDLKRLLAYCSVENVGLIAAGLGGALLAGAGNEAAGGNLLLAGALLHVWNHGAFKALLFFGAGAVLHATGTREMNRLGGLWRAMPWTASLFALGSLAVAGLPPLNGFVSEWLIYLGLFDAAASRGEAAGPAGLTAILIATAGALALATFIKASALVFLGAGRTPATRHAHECGALMRGPMLFLGTTCVFLGLGPLAVWPAIARAAASWGGALSPVGEPPDALAMLGRAQRVLAVGAVVAGGALWHRVHSGRHRRDVTWDCGYAAPTARMQYVSGSFAGIVSGWFTRILRPARTLRRPRGLFPAKAFHLERVPETVLERVLGPVAAVFVRASNAVRRLQHGRLSFYILYVAAGLVAVGTFVWVGSLR